MFKFILLIVFVASFIIFWIGRREGIRSMKREEIDFDDFTDLGTSGKTVDQNFPMNAS